MLKALDTVGQFWLTRLFSVTWTSGTVTLKWHTGVVVPIFKKEDWSVYSNYRGITQFSLHGKVYSRVLERNLSSRWWILDSRGTMGISSWSWNNRPTFYPWGLTDMFIGLRQANLHVFCRLTETLRNPGECCGGYWALCYGISGSCVCIFGTKSSMFPVDVGLHQGRPLSPMLCGRKSSGSRTSKLRRCSWWRDDQDTWFCWQFEAKRKVVRMRLSTSKSEALVLCRKICHSTLGVSF